MRFVQLISATVNRSSGGLRANEIGVRGLRLILLVAFTSASVGIPVGDWSRFTETKAASATPWCRCSTSAKRVGSCCCATSPTGAAASGAKPSGCCAERTNKASCVTPPKAGSCCSQERVPDGNQSKDIALASSPTDEFPAWTARCACGPNDVPGLLVDHSPKLVPVRAELFGINQVGAAQGELIVHAGGLRSEPIVPPPEFSLLGA